MLNFSIAYGKTAHGLSRDWGTTLKEAQETVERWYSDRPELRAQFPNRIHAMNYCQLALDFATLYVQLCNYNLIKCNLPVEAESFAIAELDMQDCSIRGKFTIVLCIAGQHGIHSLLIFRNTCAATGT